jgi:hypothetical protein
VALLTVETLLFAAFAVAASFVPRTPAGWDLPTSLGRFAWLVAVSILIVGVGAGIAWGDVYLRCNISLLALLEGIFIAFGIVALGLMSAWVASTVSRNAP